MFMRNFKKRIRNAATISAMLLATVFGLTACGGSSSNSAVSGGETSSQSKETEAGGSDETKQAWDLTLADGEAKLICHDGSFISIAYHGPYQSIGASFVQTSGESIGAFVRYVHPSDGWTIILSDEFPDDCALEDVMLSVSDYDAEKNADGTHQSEQYSFTEAFTKEEAEAIGLNIIADHICVVAPSKPSYGWDNFTAPFLYFSFLDEYHGKSIEEIDGFVDGFSYYAEDGTPLEECFEGYTMERQPSASGGCISLYFYKDDTSDSSSVLKEQNKAMCDELKELNPYALYTAENGAEQRFPFFNEE